jgi:hypothetical protein
MVEAFEGNKAETTTMLPTIRAFMHAHRLADVTIVADAGMVSDANKRAIEGAGLSFILGARMPDIPYVIAQWRRDHPDQPMPDGLILTQPWPAGPADQRRDQVIYYQYTVDRAPHIPLRLPPRERGGVGAVAGVSSAPPPGSAGPCGRSGLVRGGGVGSASTMSPAGSAWFVRALRLGVSGTSERGCQERRDQVQREGEHDRGLLAAELDEGLLVAQLHRGGVAAEYVRGVEQLLGRLEFAFG